MLRLNLKVGQTIAVGGPTNIRVERKSGQEVGLVFDADRSVPIRIVPAEEAGRGVPEPQGTSLGLDGNGPPPKSALFHDK